jgi:hypothetical protein
MSDLILLKFSNAKIEFFVDLTDDFIASLIDTIHCVNNLFVFIS